jgi:hypothetical protein
MHTLASTVNLHPDLRGVHMVLKQLKKKRKMARPMEEGKLCCRGKMHRNPI